MSAMEAAPPAAAAAAASSAETRPDPKRDADAYIEKHNLLKLFQDLGTLLV